MSSDTPRLGLMKDASYLLPDPGGEVVRDLIDRLDAMTAERNAAQTAHVICDRERQEAREEVARLTKLITALIARAEAAEAEVERLQKAYSS